MTYHNQAQPNQGSPEQRSLFLYADTLGHACCVSTTIRLALGVFPGEIPAELTQTAHDVETDLRVLVQLGSDELLAPRFADAVQVIGYMGVACSAQVSYINSEGPRRPRLTSAQQEAARVASIAAAVAAEENETQRQRSLYMALRFGGNAAVAILTRADPAREQGF